jgi:hypothetical protein
VSRFVAPKGYYSVADIADLEEKDRTSAYRWLQRNCAADLKYIGRYPVIGKERYRRRRLARYIEDKLATVEAKLFSLDERFTEEVMRLDGRINAMSRQTPR